MNAFQTATLVFNLILSMAGLSLGQDRPEDSITEAELRDHVYYLASDDMGGRVVYSSQYRIAVDYVANQFRTSGIQPLFQYKDGKPSYLQEVPMVKRSVVPKSPLTITTPKGSHSFDALKDTGYFFYKDLGVFKKNLPLVFIGYGIHDSDSGWNDFEGMDLEGKIAVILAGAPEKNGKPVLARKIHDEYETDHPVIRFLSKHNSVENQDSKPAALLVITDKFINREWKSFGAAYQGFGVYLASDASKGMDAISFDTMLISREMANALFEAQEYNPLKTDSYDPSSYKTFELDGVSINLDLEYDLEAFMSWNVAGLVQGTDPDLKEEHIIVGAHLDHLPPYRGQVYNGADDNASGSAGVIEIAEAIAMAPPRRPVIFALWTGEEPIRGDSRMGSKYFLANPPAPLNQFQLNINLDMIGRTTSMNKNSRAHIVGSKEELMPAVKRIVTDVNSRTIEWPIKYEPIISSDHMSFMENGIPGLIFFSGRHKDIHKTTDDADKIDFDKMENISKLAYFLTWDLANREQLPAFE